MLNENVILAQNAMIKKTTAAILYETNSDLVIENLNLAAPGPKEVFVQMKLSEIKEKSMADEIVPEISRCANSQNKVKSPDFSSTHPFHRQIEKLSRRIYAPTTNNQIKPSKWFYERTRGQYLDNKSKWKERYHKSNRNTHKSLYHGYF